MTTYKEVITLAREKEFDYILMECYPDYDIELLQSVLIQQWLRDEHKISVEVNSTLDSLIKGKPEYHFGASKWGNNKKYKCGENYSSYEQALLEGLHEALKLLP